MVFRPQNPNRNPMRPVQELLSRANNLLAAGQPQEAAPLFAQLAQMMEERGNAIRAANLHARAAHAYADSRDPSSALSESRRALTQFIQLDLRDRTPIFYTNIMRKLNARGMKAAADSLKGEFEGKVGPLIPQVVPTLAQSRHLPEMCPHCGAPIISTEIEWIDERSAVCSYCGNVILTEA